jgi:hypothetical protein
MKIPMSPNGSLAENERQSENQKEGDSFSFGSIPLKQ